MYVSFFKGAAVTVTNGVVRLVAGAVGVVKGAPQLQSDGRARLSIYNSAP